MTSIFKKYIYVFKKKNPQKKKNILIFSFEVAPRDRIMEQGAVLKLWSKGQS
jgi:hypothetical protein